MTLFKGRLLRSFALVKKIFNCTVQVRKIIITLNNFALSYRSETSKGTQALRYSRHLVTCRTFEHRHLGIWAIKALGHSGNYWGLEHVAQTYLEASQKSTIELFCKTTCRLLATIFSKCLHLRCLTRI